MISAAELQLTLSQYTTESNYVKLMAHRNVSIQLALWIIFYNILTVVFKENEMKWFKLIVEDDNIFLLKYYLILYWKK